MWLDLTSLRNEQFWRVKKWILNLGAKEFMFGVWLEAKAAEKIKWVIDASKVSLKFL